MFTEKVISVELQGEIKTAYDLGGLAAAHIVLKKNGFKLPKEEVSKLIRQTIDTTPALRRGYAIGRQACSVGRKKMNEVKAEAELSISTVALCNAAQKVDGVCSGTFSLANGNIVSAEAHKPYKKKMKSIADSLQKHRKSMLSDKLLPRTHKRNSELYIVSFTVGTGRNKASFCKVGIAEIQSLDKRIKSLESTYNTEIKRERVFRFGSKGVAKKMEQLLLSKFEPARKTAQDQYPDILYSGQSGYTEVMLKMHLEEVMAKAEALYLFLV